MGAIGLGAYGLSLLAAGVSGQSRTVPKAEQTVRQELAELSRKVPKFRVISLGKSGVQSLTVDGSLTADDLRGVLLDPHPPKLGSLVKPYEANQRDGVAEGAVPYIAPGIGPFRFQYFNCEFNYGGWHTQEMQEYAALHGFNILYPYDRTVPQRSRMPAGTRWMTWSGYVNWDEWMPKHGIPAGRYDLLRPEDLEAQLISGRFLGDLRPADWQAMMIDMEHAVLLPDALRTQAWYPREGTAEERSAFEKRYYAGFAATYIAPMAAAKRLGFRNLSVYGWEPFARTWYGLENFSLNPKTYAPWNLFGKQIHDSSAADIMNPSLYVYYWTAQNVASTICNLDFNRELVASTKKPKPIRPYYWTMLHGGDANPHWWKDQPVPNEEAEAWTFFCLMSGVDGFDLWNWSGTGNHNVPNPWVTVTNGAAKGNDLGVKSGFTAVATGDNGRPMRFSRYDFIHVVSFDEKAGQVRFQRIEKENLGGNFGISGDKPVYSMTVWELLPHLRAPAEPVAGVVQGMALAKVFEEFLHAAKPKVDVSSLLQFLETLPIVRRASFGPCELVATYDPKVVYGGEPRPVVLKDFLGKRGFELHLPADGRVRVWVLRRPG